MPSSFRFATCVGIYATEFACGGGPGPANTSVWGITLDSLSYYASEGPPLAPPPSSWAKRRAAHVVSDSVTPLQLTDGNDALRLRFDALAADQKHFMHDTTNQLSKLHRVDNRTAQEMSTVWTQLHHGQVQSSRFGDQLDHTKRELYEAKTR